MSKKIFLNVTIGMISIMVIFIFCSGATAKTITIKLATSAAVNNITLSSIEGAGLSSEHTVAVVFKRIVEQKSGGQINVKIFPDSQLGDEREQWQSMQEEILQMSTASAATLAGFVPEWMAFSIPYLTDSEEVFLDVLNSPIGTEFKDLVKKKINVRILGWSWLGFRNFTANKPIKSIADIKGMKIRVTQSPEKVKLVEGLGAHATPISWSELYTSLQQGVVDGEENPLSMIEQAKLYEVQKYMILDGHTLGVLPISISEKFFQTLSPEHQRIIQDAALKAITVYRAQVYLGNTLWIEDLEKKGMKIYAPTLAELEEFRQGAQGAVIPYIRSQIGDAWVDKVLKAVEQSEKKLFN